MKILKLFLVKCLPLKLLTKTIYWKFMMKKLTYFLTASINNSCPSSQVFSNKISIKSQPRVTLFIGFIKMVLPSRQRPEDYFLVVTKLSRPRKLGMNSSVLA